MRTSSGPDRPTLAKYIMVCVYGVPNGLNAYFSTRVKLLLHLLLPDDNIIRIFISTFSNY